jgi:hypothetical protein
MATKQPEFQEKIQNILERRRYSLLAFCFTAFWLAGIIVIFILKINLPSSGYWLLAGTTVQVCRLPIIAMKYFFEK